MKIHANLLSTTVYNATQTCLCFISISLQLQYEFPSVIFIIITLYISACDRRQFFLSQEKIFLKILGAMIRMKEEGEAQGHLEDLLEPLGDLLEPLMCTLRYLSWEVLIYQLYLFSLTYCMICQLSCFVNPIRRFLEIGC
ncbi:hypothetical protein HELRODRAFT_172482 [Helobdella robusta]|uniref:Uncharacterized protein n=1 Tax=Helobdella robusta TaxID=6412 RepID=T1F5D8_HELRO|nr:hypothetical protein HELRODRAFT_172482 [Helobdella robusta]ESO04807.1 hypothetical protein HELRODRAFT_172482 [Helobdella robusta]